MDYFHPSITFFWGHKNTLKHFIIVYSQKGSVTSSFTIQIQLISQSSNVRKITILRNRLFSLSGSDVAILVSYNRFSVGFNLKHYQISKDLSYLHLYKRLLSIFREVVVLEELLFCKILRNIF